MTRARLSSSSERSPTEPSPGQTEWAIVRLLDGNDSGPRLYRVHPARAFCPRALLLWGTTAETFVRRLVVDGTEQLLCRLPGHLFAPELSHESFSELLLERFDGHDALDGITPLGPLFQFELPAVAAGEPIAIELVGPLRHGVLLGHMDVIEPAPLLRQVLDT